ncbi:MAG: flippase [Archaeoglobales archaeon]|nr:flippase [Archaeoglobales archaeon]
MLAKQVFRNFIYNASSLLIGNLSGLIVSIYLAKTLKPELFGIYSLVLSIAYLVLSLTDLGINAATTRYVADAYFRQDFESLRGYIKNLAILKLLLSALASLLTLISAEFISIYFFAKPELYEPLVFSSAFIFFYSLSGYLNSIYNAFKDFKASLIRSLSYEASKLLFIIIFVYVGLEVVGAILGLVMASLASLVVLILYSKKYKFFYGKTKKIHWFRVIKFTSYLTIGSITWIFFAYVDSIMIGYFLPAEAVGYYRAAFSIISAVSGLISVTTVLFPVFIELEGKRLKNAFVRTFKYSAIISIPAAFGLAMISGGIVVFVYGHEYLNAINSMRILSFLLIPYCLNLWSNLFNAKEMPQYPVYVLSVAMVLNIILNWFMIPIYGIDGAALATLISNFLNWILLGLFAYKKFSIFPLTLTIKPIFASTTMVAAIYYLNLLDRFLAILFGSVVYFLTIFIIKGLSSEDYKFFKSLFT